MPDISAADKFPLRLHRTGQYRKRFRGKDYYFGTDRAKALTEYGKFLDDPDGYRAERTRPETDLRVRDAVNAFLTAKRDKVDAGELTAGMWSQYHGAADRVVAVFGATRFVSSLRPADFAALRAAAAKRLGSRALGQFITMVRSLFTWCYKAELMDTPVRTGNGFDRPPKRTVRLARERRGTLLVSAEDLNRLIDAADVQMKAMVCLGINAGFGSADCSRLNRADLAREPGWLSGTREKTATPRRCKLWPETTAALEAVAKVRPRPKDPGKDGDAVFLTRMGRRWVRITDRGAEGKRVSRRDTLGTAFDRLAKSLGVKIGGRFYALRHSFLTVADECRDRVAVGRIMGHSDNTISDSYRERIDDARLVAVADHVRAWLLAGRPKKSGTRAKGKK